MKTVVFAYHDMGCLGIEALLSAGYEISAIFTHTDNPGEKAFYGSVARLAAERGIPVYAIRGNCLPVFCDQNRWLRFRAGRFPEYYRV